MEETGNKPVLTYRREDEYYLGEVSDAEDIIMRNNRGEESWVKAMTIYFLY